MLNMLRYYPILSVLVPTGDVTDLTVPAVVAGVGIGIVIIALLARRRGKEDDRDRASKPKGRHTE
ncbi:MAG TPA: hypothetical protein PK071_00860 [Atopobiaceae bacterium]|nr:hypothetical protein [Atopobiaceae bacterium]